MPDTVQAHRSVEEWEAADNIEDLKGALRAQSACPDRDARDALLRAQIWQIRHADSRERKENGRGQIKLGPLQVNGYAVRDSVRIIMVVGILILSYLLIAARQDMKDAREIVRKAVTLPHGPGG